MGSGQTRARYPDAEGLLDRDGVQIHWESYGHGSPTILFMPTWSIIHSRCWKMQIPEFARRHRVLTFDPRGNGASSHVTEPSAYAEEEFAADALAVLDATATDEAIVAGLSLGAQRSLLLAAEHPGRVRAVVLIGPMLCPEDLSAEQLRAAVEFHLDTGRDEGWGRYNAHSWRRDYRGFLEFFFGQAFTEPHSTKQIEDCVGWGLDTDAEALIASEVPALGADQVAALCSRVSCPVLVVHGDEDAIVPHSVGADAARLSGGRLVTFEGGGHIPNARDPVRFNLELREFIGSVAPPRSRWTRARSRTKRALYVSSPIGLGHVRRDLAIADQLRALDPELEIEWLAQHPVTAVLEERGERVHPASAELASESGHMQAEARGHELHCFGALRRMDEILLANFMVFDELASAENYDLWIGDEAWDVDYYLHENPERKTASYAWLTDFVGYLPMPGGGAQEALLTADYNAEMIEHIARFPRVRDRAIFIGEADDIVPDTFGPGLPSIREWTERHFSFAGYVTGFSPARVADRAGVRAELGYGADEPVCVVSVGGSGVGKALLARLIESLPAARRRVPGLRMVLVAGPRIDPRTLPDAEGLEIRDYVPDLYRHLAACDLAIVQGGLTTTMELVATGRPFIYFPLAGHFEQNFHVRHRLDRHRAGRMMEFEHSPPEAIADAIADELGRELDYLPVATDGAVRAAALIAELL